MFYPTTCVGLRYGPCPRLCLAVFLGSMFPPAVRSPRGARGTVASRPPGGFACRALSLPRFNVLFRQHAGFPLLRRRVARGPGAGILTGSPSGRALRLPLRPRLTLIRLALIRNPWSYGGGVSRPPCRYLYLHLLFRCLQHGSRRAFDGCLNAPLPTRCLAPRPTASAAGLMPDYYPCGAARLVSCYALFK